MDKEFYTFEEVKDELIGKCGTPSRDEYEAEIEAHLIGQHIREARKSLNLTQKELGERLGVQTAQISKIENGRNITIATIVRVLNALGLSADFSIQGLKPVRLGAGSC